MNVQSTTVNKRTQLVSLMLVSLVALTGMAYINTAPVLADDTKAVCDHLPAELKAECQAGQTGVRNLIAVVINVLTYIVGIAAVVMLIIAGLMYTVSGGDPDRLKTAKNMIIYSMVGIVIAFAGQAIIRFVLSNV